MQTDITNRRAYLLHFLRTHKSFAYRTKTLADIAVRSYHGVNIKIYPGYGHVDSVSKCNRDLQHLARKGLIKLTSRNPNLWKATDA